MSRRFGPPACIDAGQAHSRGAIAHLPGSRGDGASRSAASRKSASVMQRASPMVKNGKSKKNRLRVRRVVHVPLREVSGICLGRRDNNRMFLIAAGDRAAEIAWFSLSGSEEVQIDWHTRSLAELTGSKLPERNPQIEAVCADGGGRILLLQETPPRLSNTAAATSS